MTEEILEPVVVVVADADADGPTGILQAGFFGDVGERAIAIIFVEAIAGALAEFLQPAPAEDKDVHPAIVVVIEKSAAAAHDLRNISCARAVAVEHRLR